MIGEGERERNGRIDTFFCGFELGAPRDLVERAMHTVKHTVDDKGACTYVLWIYPYRCNVRAARESLTAYNRAWLTGKNTHRSRYFFSPCPGVKQSNNTVAARSRRKCTVPFEPSLSLSLCCVMANDWRRVITLGFRSSTSAMVSASGRRPLCYFLITSKTITTTIPHIPIPQKERTDFWLTRRSSYLSRDRFPFEKMNSVRVQHRNADQAIQEGAIARSRFPR